MDENKYIFSSYSTEASDQSSLSQEDIEKLIDEWDVYKKDPNYIDEILVTELEIFADHDKMIKFNTYDEKKYVIMHLDVFKKLEDEYGVVRKEHSGIPSIFDTPVVFDDFELFKVWSKRKIT